MDNSISQSIAVALPSHPPFQTSPHPNQVVIGGHATADFASGEYCGALIQYPNTYGRVDAYDAFVQHAHANDVLVVAATVRVGGCGFEWVGGLDGLFCAHVM